MRLQLATVYLQLAQPKDAANSLRAALKEFPDSVPILRALARANMADAKPRFAIAHLRKAIELRENGTHVQQAARGHRRRGRSRGYDGVPGRERRSVFDHLGDDLRRRITGNYLLHVGHEATV